VDGEEIKRWEEDGWWPFYTSSSFNPTYLFLEAIWTRLSYQFTQISEEVFGEDLKMEPASRFLDCRIKIMNEYHGWEYSYFAMTDKSLKSNKQSKEWSPIELDLHQYVIIEKLCREGEIDITNNSDIQQLIISTSYSSTTNFVEKLKATGLVCVENNKLILLTDECRCVILPNGKLYAGENKSGRLISWVKKEMERLKK